MDVKIAGIPDNKPIQCSNGVIITPDIGIKEVPKNGPFDAMILPGGLNGSQAMADSMEMGCLLRQQYASGRIIAAICAGKSPYDYLTLSFIVQFF